MKRLVTFGCSFTEGIVRCPQESARHGRQLVPRTWGQRISENLNINFENQGHHASSNMQIGNTLYNFDFQQNDIVIIAWSGPVRQYWWNDEIKRFRTVKLPTKTCDCGTKHDENLYLSEVMIRYVKDYLEHNNIPYLMTSAFVDYKVVFDHILDWSRFNWIEPEIYNNTFYDIMSETWLYASEPLFHDFDLRKSHRNENIAGCYHPTQEGHDLIGDTITPYISKLL